MVTKMPGRVALHKTNEREQPDTKQGEHLTLKKRNQDGNREHQSEGRTTFEESTKTARNRKPKQKAEIQQRYQQHPAKDTSVTSQR